MFLNVICRTDHKDTMKIDPDFHFYFLTAIIRQSPDLADLEISYVGVHHGNVTIIFSLDAKGVTSIESEDFGEWDLMKFGEDHHVPSVGLGLPVQFDGIRLKRDGR